MDVLIRFQSRPYEYWVMRFTAFPVADGGEFQEIPRWYWYDGPREVLGRGCPAGRIQSMVAPTEISDENGPGRDTGHVSRNADTSAARQPMSGTI